MSSRSVPRPRRLSRGKRLVFTGVATCFVLAALEGLASFAWIAADLFTLWNSGPRVGQLKEEFHCQYDPQLGWVNTPSTRIEDFYGDGRTITINADGLRGLEDYGGHPPGDRFRAVVLGDSFTLGYGVDDRHTFPQMLQDAQPEALQVVNQGQGGYSVGQCWLWHERLRDQLQPDALIGVFIVEDFRRLTVDRTANGFATPRFRSPGRSVVVENTPVPPKLDTGTLLVRPGEIADLVSSRSSLFQAIRAAVPLAAPRRIDDSTALRTGLAILHQLHQTCRSNGCPMVLVLTPTLPELFDPAAHAAYADASRVLSDWASRAGVPFRDLRPEFLAQRHQAGALFLEEAFHHYSRRGNRLVAESLSEWLPTVIPDFPRAAEPD